VVVEGEVLAVVLVVVDRVVVVVVVDAVGVVIVVVEDSWGGAVVVVGSTTCARAPSAPVARQNASALKQTQVLRRTSSS
jgi:hypothetical protein